MNITEVMNELESLGKERTKKLYLANGAREPLFGVTTGSMKPLSKIIKKDQLLAEELYATGNYDAMYFAGVISDPALMTENDFERWIDGAYFYMISDYIVAVTLAESPLRLKLAQKWIDSDQELRRSAGWSCLCWSLGRWPDSQFDPIYIKNLLNQAKSEILTAPDRVKTSISNFIYTVGLSYLPLHEDALTTAADIGEITISRQGKKDQKLNPFESISKEIDKGRIGFKRKYVRC